MRLFARWHPGTIGTEYRDSTKRIDVVARVCGAHICHFHGVVLLENRESRNTQRKVFGFGFVTAVYAGSVGSLCCFETCGEEEFRGVSGGFGAVRAATVQ